MILWNTLVKCIIKCITNENYIKHGKLNQFYVFELIKVPVLLMNFPKKKKIKRKTK